MNDKILYGNILGLLKTGKWSLGVAEASALVEIYNEVSKRYNPPKVEQTKEPIKKTKQKKVSANDGP